MDIYIYFEAQRNILAQKKVKNALKDGISEERGLVSRKHGV